jgi:hypothetical protein
VKKNKPVTARQRALIRNWTCAGELEQQEVAARLGLTRATVWKTQKKLGIRQLVRDRLPLSEATENKIIMMLRQNCGRMRITRETGVALSRIDRIAKRIHFRRQRGSATCAYRLTASEIARIRRAVTESERAICKQFHVSRVVAAFSCGEFFKETKMMDDYIALISAVCRVCFRVHCPQQMIFKSLIGQDSHQALARIVDTVWPSHRPSRHLLSPHGPRLRRQKRGNRHSEESHYSSEPQLKP